MSKKAPPKWYSPEEMEALRKNPNVSEVRENRMLLTLEFRQQYEEWVLEPVYFTVRRMLETNGFDTQRIGESFTRAIAYLFRLCVSPGRVTPVFKSIAGNTGSMGRDTLRSKTRGRGSYYDSITVSRYAKHPYIQSATREKIELKPAFFKDAAPMERNRCSRGDGSVPHTRDTPEADEGDASIAS